MINLAKPMALALLGATCLLSYYLFVFPDRRMFLRLADSPSNSFDVARARFGARLLVAWVLRIALAVLVATQVGGHAIGYFVPASGTRLPSSYVPARPPLAVMAGIVTVCLLIWVALFLVDFRFSERKFRLRLEDLAGSPSRNAVLKSQMVQVASFIGIIAESWLIASVYIG